MDQPNPQLQPLGIVWAAWSGITALVGLGIGLLLAGVGGLMRRSLTGGGARAPRRTSPAGSRMIVILLTLTGCNGPLVEALDVCPVVMPDDFSFEMDAGFLVQDDGIGGLALGVFGVDELESCAAQLEIVSGWSGASLFPEHAITFRPELDALCSSAPDDEACDGYFDPNTGRYAEVADDFGDLHPTYVSGPTDPGGNFAVYVLFDIVPVTEDGTLVPFSIYASNSQPSSPWTLLPMEVGAE